jgi:long-chain acyl-CoA synthetase
MTGGWTITRLLDALAQRGRHPGVIVSGQAGVTICDCATLAADAAALARGLCEIGASGAPTAIWAPNSPEWITAALGALASGSVLVPLDDLADTAQFRSALQSSKAGTLFIGSRHLDVALEATGGTDARIFLLDAEGSSAAPRWRVLLRATGEPPAVPASDAPAVLFSTSGTTGAPKVFHLTHANIAANVEALQETSIIGPDDRALLPLPLHHAYPFIVGMLATLTLGAAVVLPGDTSGPAILKALRDGEATTIIGVPRLYDAVLAALDSRLASRAWPLRLAVRGLLGASSAVRRTTGLRLGRLLFAPIRRGIAPGLRLLVCGGARLELTTEDRVEALGWTVLSGYGLAETASLFTGNLPHAYRRGSTGRPLAGGEIRIGNPDEHGAGEIELRGRSLTAGYLDNPEANRTGFTVDGWFRTGDLGTVDRDGFLFVTGRAKEILVLGGGKKVNPEDLERVYGAAPQICEIAVLENEGALVALVRPDAAKLREIGSTNLRDGVRVVLAEIARQLPPYLRPAGFALTDQPLPRTRLGKYRRFLLPPLYEDALAGRAPQQAHALSEEDTALLADPTARAVWAFLREHYPAGATGLDVNLALDLNLDSFAWMELTIALHDRLGLRLSEADVAGIETIRDLLRRCVEQHAGLMPARLGAPAIAEDVDRWLAPTGLLVTALGVLLYAINWLVMRALFRLRVTGLENLPAQGPFVITPNHVSDLDAMAIAAALPLSRLRRVYWAGDIVRLFYNSVSRLLCRAMHLFPVDETHPGAAVRSAARVLESGKAQVWFPEGWRSPDGRLQRFLPGIGQLLLRSHAPAVPAWISGAFEALPRGKRIPRFHQVTLDFGSPVDPETLRSEGTGRSAAECVAQGLRGRVTELARVTGHTVEEVAPDTV